MNLLSVEVLIKNLKHFRIKKLKVTFTVSVICEFFQGVCIKANEEYTHMTHIHFLFTLTTLSQGQGL